MISIVPQTYCSQTQITTPKNPENNTLRRTNKYTQDQVLKTNYINIGHQKNTNNDNIRVRLLDGCRLGISNFSFDYNAEGGRGVGTRTKATAVDQDQKEADWSTAVVTYDVDMRSVFIPAVTTSTATVNGFAPFPPFVKVEIVPKFIRGSIHQTSRKVELEIIANLCLSIGSYAAPPLQLNTVLTSEESKGALFGTVRGQRLGKDGKCKVVGVARVDSIVDNYINSLIGLPCECLVILNTSMTFF